MLKQTLIAALALSAFALAPIAAQAAVAAPPAKAAMTEHFNQMHVRYKVMTRHDIRAERHHVMRHAM